MSVRCDDEQCGGGEENVCMFYLSISLLFVQSRCVTRHVALSVSGRNYVECIEWHEFDLIMLLYIELCYTTSSTIKLYHITLHHIHLHYHIMS